ncbi:hypothetical protein T484DRAFT_2977852 [Baffinella frigidus]|nr:hypothetical protein T484DRAFT_2977852 [Cryptophyta sp. CCMP2293]
MSEVPLQRPDVFPAYEVGPVQPLYRGTSRIRNRTHLGPYSRPKNRALGGGALSYERGTPVQASLLAPEGDVVGCLVGCASSCARYPCSCSTSFRGTKSALQASLLAPESDEDHGGDGQVREKRVEQDAANLPPFLRRAAHPHRSLGYEPGSFQPPDVLTSKNTSTPPKRFHTQRRFHTHTRFHTPDAFTAQNAFTPQNAFSPKDAFTPHNAFAPTDAFTPYDAFAPQNAFAPTDAAHAVSRGSAPSRR